MLVRLTQFPWKPVRYREAGAEVIEVMSQFSTCLERASIDEAYLDVTKEAEERLKSATFRSVTIDQVPNTFIEGWGAKEEDDEEDEEKKKEKGSLSC